MTLEGRSMSLTMVHNHIVRGYDFLLVACSNHVSTSLFGYHLFSLCDCQWLWTISVM